MTRPPGVPRDAGDLDLRAVTTAEGAETVAQLAALRARSPTRGKVQSIAAPYRDAARHKMLVPELWNLPDAYSRASSSRAASTGRARRATRSAATAAAWATGAVGSLEPAGPDRVKPFPKVPERDGAPVPMLIGQGMDDQVIHRRPADGTPGADVHPQPPTA